MFKPSPFCYNLLVLLATVGILEVSKAESEMILVTVEPPASTTTNGSFEGITEEEGDFEMECKII